MKPRTHLLVFLSALLSLSLVTGCGTGSNQQALQTTRELLSGALDRNAPAQDPRAVLTRARINQAQTPLILVDTLQFSGSGTMLSTGQAGLYSSWAGGDGAGIILFDDGLLVGTRGYGDDLISSDVEAVATALRSGDGMTAVRVMRFVDGQDDDYTRSMVCSYADAGREVISIFDQEIAVSRRDETCRTRDAEVQNTYWVADDGFIWRSIQFAGPDLGYFQIERLFR